MRLKIDTSSAQDFARVGSLSPASAHPTSAMSRTSSRVSPGSSRSSLSITSTNFSSENASSSVNVIPQAARSLQDSAAQSYIPWSTDSLRDDSHDPDPDFVLAMHDFFPQHRNATCLAFQAGQIIHVLNRDPSGWWDGEADGHRGWFPSNYVTATANLLTEEELPNASTFKPGHIHSTSAISATSWTTVTSPRNNSFMGTDYHPPPSENLVSDVDSYCPVIMVPLLHGLSLLQTAVRSNRGAHFQPSTACIISCVRSILASTGCLSRDAVLLQRFRVLYQERKRILSDLAGLVTQSKKASDDLDDDRQREIEVQAMLRLGGQVFAHVRRFLAVAVQCGVQLPENGRSLESESSSTGPETSLLRKRNPLVDGYEHEDKTDDDDNETFVRRSPVRRTTSGAVHRPPLASRSAASESPRLTLRAKSMTDLRGRRPLVNSKPDPKSKQSPMKRYDTSPSAARVTLVPTSGHRRNGLSVASISSSSSSSSSIESVKTPDTPKFPDGPCSVTEVMEALRHTHDQYLSTIAAFIGHAHSHSRTSHASSTGHMFELVKEVVEMVCRLLTIVDSVMKHQAIPSHKVANLKAAKHSLFNVTTSLAESVRILTSGSAGEKSEEQERSELLRSATNALKAGGDCVNEVKKCLTWSVGDKPIVIKLPLPVQFAAEDLKKSHSKGRVEGAPLARAISLTGPRVRRETDEMVVDDEDDLTIQAQSPTPALPLAKNEDVKSPTDGLSPPLPENRPLSPLFIPTDQIQPDLSSPVSLARADDDRTAWEGSQHATRPSQDTVDIIPLTPNQDGSATRKMLSHDYSIEDVAYNKEGVLVGATLDCLVEKMTPHDNIVEPAFAAVFFLTFRLFASSQDLVNAIISRYNLLPPSGLTEEDLYVWQQRKGVPVRLRVANFLKLWLETFWRSSTDDQVLGTLMAFTRDALAAMFPNPSQRVMELIILRSQQTDSILSPRIHDAGLPINPAIHSTVSGSMSDIPRPIMTKTLLAAVRARNFSSISVLDFDALELARQMTIMESRLYCAITAEEILDTGKTPSGGPIKNVNVKGVTTLSTVITGWIAESILNEADAKKRTALIKFFIKLSDRCNSLNNFSTPRAILAALDSSTISRLHQTWTGLSQKYKAQLEVLRKLADHARNYSEYRGRLRNTSPPAVPFLGLYLTDITFCREGNPSHRPSPLAPEKKLINFNKYHKLARIVQDMQRFQIPYNFKEIPEVHDFLNVAFEKAKRSGDIQDLYRRSLLIEPKQPADMPPTNDVRQLFSWASRSSTSTAPTLA